MAEHETYTINIAGLDRDLRLFEIKPGVRIAILNIPKEVHKENIQ